MKKTLLLFLSIILTGCLTMDQSVEVRNATSKTVDKVTLTSSHGFHSGFGILSPGAQSTVGGYPTIRRKDTCRITWNDYFGKPQEQTLDLATQLPPGYSGDLMFILNENGTFTVKPRYQN